MTGRVVNRDRLASARHARPLLTRPTRARGRHRGMDETIGSGPVPADPGRPGFDVLGARLGARTHYINCVLAAAAGPLTPKQIRARAKDLAARRGPWARRGTFSIGLTQGRLLALRAAPNAPLA